MASYTRQSTFSDGDLITAALFNDEYNQLVAAFDNATGHKHDGTIGEGPVISVLGDAGLSTPLNKILVDTTNDHIEFYIDVSGTSTQQLYIADGAIVPATNDDVDLGTSASKFKDLYLSGTANITGNAVVTGNLTVEGTTVTLNTATLDVEDKNITLNYGTGDTSSNADGAGITIQDAVDASTDATILWNATNDRFDFSHAIDVTGSATVDGLTSNGDITVNTENAELQLVDTSSGNTTSILSNNFDTTISADGRIFFRAGGSNDNVIQISSGGDISFYEDTGTTAKLFWDASAEKLGIGTTSPTGLLHTKSTGDNNFYFESGVTNLGQILFTDGSIAGRIKYNHSDDSMAFFVNASEKARFNSTGLGINTQTPSTTLDVNGTITYGSLSDGTITITGFADEDDMISNSATLVPTQQSVKAYVDAQISSAGDDGISFADNEKAKFGDSDDLEIYHDGNNSYIAESGTGSLLISGGANVKIQSPSDEDMIIATANGAVTLYHNNSAKIATTETGIDVTGTTTTNTLDVDDVKILSAQSSTVTDDVAALIYRTSGHASYANGDLIIQARSNASRDIYFLTGSTTPVNRMQINGNGNISFYDDTGASENLKWDASADSLNFVDNAKAAFGTSLDLLIYHTGTQSYIEDAGSGNLNFKSNGNFFNFLDGSNNLVFQIDLDSATKLYHNTSEKLATTSTGIDVTGTVTADGLTVNSGDTSSFLTIRNGSNSSFTKLYSDLNGVTILDVDANNVGAAPRFQIDVSEVQALRITEGGDISFYDDTGTTQGLFWDASTGRLGIGTTSPSRALSVEGNTFLSGDNRHVYFGGNNTFIGERSNSTHLELRGGGSSASQTVYIDNNGSLGLGTASPQAKLQINDGYFYFKNDSYSDNNRIGFGNPARDGDAGYIDYIGVGNFTGHLAFGLVTSATNTAATEVARFNNAGNFGIGQTSPNTKLHVAGDIRLQNSGKVYLWNDHNLNYIDYTKWQSSASAGMTINNSAAGYLRFNTSNTERVRIDSSGNVGIGTTTPTNSITTTGALEFTGNAFNGSGTGVWSPATNELGFVTSGSTQVRINSSGNVGIGTSSPSELLHLNGSSDSVKGLIQNNSTSTSAYATLGFQSDYSHSVNPALFLTGSNNTNYAGANSLNMYQFGDFPLGFVTNNTLKMIIQGDGNVGIGTDNPNAPLHIANGTPAIRLEDTSAGVSHYLNSNNAEFRVQASGSLALYTAGNNRVHINNTGSVGIGTTAPSSKLDVITSSQGDTGFKVGHGSAYNLTVGTSTSHTKYNLADGDYHHKFNTRTSAGASLERFKIEGGADTANVIFSNSNVGIGTDSPTSTLTVDGTINGVGIKANETDFSGSILISDDGATGTLSSATSNTGLGSLVLANLTSGASNVAVGRQALNSLTTGSNNTAVGRNALLSNTTASNNVAVGYSALSDNTTGAFNTAVGRDALGNNTTASNNTAIGYASLLDNTTGNNNTAVGYETMKRNTEGIRNTAIGQQALAFNTTGNNNTALGLQALFKNTTGESNTSVGYDSLEQNTTGNNNVAVGYQALDFNTEGSSNIAIGRDAMQLNTTGNNNVAMGYEALHTNSTGHSNTAIGYQASFAITTGIRNTALGYQSLRNQTTASGTVAVGHNALFNNTTGSGNVAIGYTAMSQNQTGESNTAVGYEALQDNLAQSHNTALGYRALKDGTTGSVNIAVGGYALANSNGNDNVAVGYSSLITNTTGTRNIAIGNYALQANTTANDLVAIGYHALIDNTTGASNVAIGKDASRLNTTGSNNVSIGMEALESSTTGTDCVVVGKQAAQSNTTGNKLTAVGYRALLNNTTGNNNVAIGYYALNDNTDGDANVAVGNDTLELATGSDNTAIGKSAGALITTGAKNTIIGRFDGNQGGLDIRTSNNHIVLSDGDGNPRQVIDDSGKVGIGTVSPETTLHVSTAKSSVTDSVLTIQDTTETFGKMIEFVGQGSTDLRGHIGFQEPEDNAPELYIACGGSDAAGVGVGLAFFNYITVNRIIPCDNLGDFLDDTIDLGSVNSRFDDIYATNTSIQTSDRNEKQDIQALTDAEQRVATACKGLLRRYRWRNAVANKDDNPDSSETARYHFGIIAQDLQDAFTAEGLDAGDYGMFISSTWWEATVDGRTKSYTTQESAPEGAVEKTRLGVRYNELLAFIIATL